MDRRLTLPAWGDLFWEKSRPAGPIEILYLFNGVVHKYRPDFLIRLKNGGFLVLETKGQDSQQDRTKREFLDEWIRAVNHHGGFGEWAGAVSKNPADLKGILKGVVRNSFELS
jgi:type III restriction enzyme